MFVKYVHHSVSPLLRYFSHRKFDDNITLERYCEEGPRIVAWLSRNKWSISQRTCGSALDLQWDPFVFLDNIDWESSSHLFLLEDSLLFSSFQETMFPCKAPTFPEIK